MAQKDWSTKHAIVKIKDITQSLREAKSSLLEVISAIDGVIEEHDTEVKNLFDSLSPLLALFQAGMLHRVIGCLDEPALFQLERASEESSVMDSEHVVNQWKRLHVLRSVHNAEELDEVTIIQQGRVFGEEAFRMKVEMLQGIDEGNDLARQIECTKMFRQ